MNERSEAEGWLAGLVGALLICPTGAVVMDTAVCALSRWKEPPSAPFDIQGKWEGGFGRAQVTTPIGSMLIGACVEWTSFGLDTEDHAASGFHNVLGYWKGNLPPKGSFIRIISPSGRVENMIIINELNGEIFTNAE